MSSSLGKLTVDMILRTGLFDSGLDKAARKSKATTKEISKDAQQAAEAAKAAFSSLGGVLVGALGALSAGAVITKLIDNTKQMEKEQAQLAAVLRSTGEAAGYNRDQLNQMGQALANASVFSTGQITEAQTTLLAFTGIMGNEFVRAQQAAADMAARTGMSIVAASETIGRALDIPSKGLTALTRQGFRFTEDQAKIALQLENTGRAAEAQAIILEALEESYGGAAKATRDTFGGALEGLSNTIGNLLTGGEGSLESARLAIERLNESLSDPQTQESFGKLVGVIVDGVATIVEVLASIPWEYTTQAVTILSGAIAARLMPSLIGVVAPFIIATRETYRYQAALAAMAGSTNLAAAGVTALGVASAAASRALALIGGPVGAILIAGTALYALTRDTTKATGDYGKSLEWLKGPIDDVTKKLQGMTKAQREASLEKAKFGIGEAADEERKAVAELQKFLMNDLPKAAKGSSGEIAALSLDLQKAMGDTTSMLTALESAAKAGLVPESVLSSVRTLGGNVDDARQKLAENEKQANDLAKALENIGNSAQNAAGGVNVLTAEMARALEGGAEYATKLADRLVTAGLKTETQKFDAMVKAGQLAFESEERMNDVRKMALDYDQRIANSTKTRSTATKKQIDETQSLLDKVLPLQKITKDYERDSALLNKAQASGKITVEQYSEAMANLNRNRADAVRNLIPEETKRMQDLERASKSGLAALIAQQELQLNTRNMGANAKEFALALSEVEERYRRIAENMAASPRGVSDEDLEKLREYKDKEFAILQEFHDKRTELDNSWIDGFEGGMQRYVDSVGTMSEQVADVVAGALGHTEDALVQLITTGEFNIGALMQSIAQDVVRMLVRMGLQMAVNFAMSKLFASASAATAGITGSSIAMAYAPAAAMASLATFGENAIPATAGIISTVGIAETMAFAGMFDDGGHIPTGKWGIVGELGPEIVQGPANVTSRVDTARALAGRSGGGTVVQIIENRERAGTTEVDNDGEEEIVRVFVSDINNNGPMYQALNAVGGFTRIGR